MTCTQPICWPCWVLRAGTRRPLHVATTRLEQCCFCGGPAPSGIYVHADPQLVPYPKSDEGAAS